MKALAPSWLDVDLPFPCEIHAPRFMTNLEPTENYRVYIDSWEPRSSCESLERIRQYADRFDLIFTKDESLLDLPNARLLIGLNSWVYPWMPSHKDFSVSFLCTSNNFLPGYEMRHRLWANQNRISIPKKFWSSRLRPVDNERLIPERTDGANDKVSLFESMFSVCPENTSERNYFTEKIIDCFVTKTVPIYWGCPNIGDFFDSRGIVFVNNVDDMVSVINRLDETVYETMLPYIETNYQKALQYSTPEIGVRLSMEIMKEKK